jgi:hypothetical protein
MRRLIPFATVAALLVGFAPASARADELKLKDGTKVSGTIVGFDDNSFKVKTSYGYALVQKDQVVSILISDSAKKPDAEKNAETKKKLEPATEKAPAPPGPAAENVNESASAAPNAKPAAPRESKPPAIAAAANPAPAVANAASTKPASAPVTPAPAANPANAKITSTPATPAPAAANSAAAKTPPPAVPDPHKPETPETVREEVNGNTYTNKTFGFQMYKPPDWQVIEGARSILPGAITAMGTADQTTYLLIGNEPAGKSLAADMDETDHRLREILENYRPLGEKRVAVSGAPVVERRFRGSIDHRDWSGVVAFIPRGAHLYTIFAMTLADTDLVQIQENVIARAISSFQFTGQ